MVLEKRLALYGRVPGEHFDLDQALRQRGFQVYQVESEAELLDIARFSQPDGIILLGIPNQALVAQLMPAVHEGGFTLSCIVAPRIPVRQACELLDAGFDYIAGSFQPDWLAAQIRALLRRVGRERSATAVIELGRLRIDLQQRQVLVDGVEVGLTPTEFSVLRVLAERPGTVLPSGEIMQQISGTRLPETEAQDLLKVHIHRLRQKLEVAPDFPKLIRTVRGHGYMYAFERRSQDRPRGGDEQVSSRATRHNSR